MDLQKVLLQWSWWKVLESLKVQNSWGGLVAIATGVKNQHVLDKLSAPTKRIKDDFTTIVEWTETKCACPQHSIFHFLFTGIYFKPALFHQELFPSAGKCFWQQNPAHLRVTLILCRLCGTGCFLTNEGKIKNIACPKILFSRILKNLNVTQCFNTWKKIIYSQYFLQRNIWAWEQKKVSAVQGSQRLMLIRKCFLVHRKCNFFFLKFLKNIF